MIKFNVPEKRKLSRAQCSFSVECEIINPIDGSKKKRIAQSKNINAQGIYLEFNEKLDLETEINIRFQLPGEKAITDAAVKVIRAEILETGVRFGVGAIFTKLNEAIKQRISSLAERLDINKLLAKVIETGASDLHLLAERKPFIRIYGEIHPLDWPEMNALEIENLISSLMTKQQIMIFDKNKELDFAVQYDKLNRFRINVHQQKGYTEATLRLITTKDYTFEELNLPDAVKELASFRDGLILVAGPTGSGKTTTIAAMIQYLNKSRNAVIISLERPIEYVYPDDKCVIKQREVGIDTLSFSAALKSSLRQDPNVIIVGELDDVETIRTAVIAAEAGHLVIASFHAPNTIQALDRLAGVVPVDARKQLLSQLSHCLRGIVTQMLLPLKHKHGQVLVTEILMATDAVKRIIRNDDLIQLLNALQTGKQYNMQTMSESIQRCVDQDIIDMQTAQFYSEEFNKYTH